MGYVKGTLGNLAQSANASVAIKVSPKKLYAKDLVSSCLPWILFSSCFMSLQGYFTQFEPSQSMDKLKYMGKSTRAPDNHS